MDLREFFSPRQKAALEALIKQKFTEDEDGHQFYPVMKSREFRDSVEITFDRKFYPLWAVMEALGYIEEPRPEGDVLLVNTCEVRHCINPDHLKWVDRRSYNATFVKLGAAHPKSIWTEEKLVRLKKYRNHGIPQSKIAQNLDVSQSTISKACKDFNI